MKKGLLGKKLGMTQVFAEDGRRIPVTVVEAGPCIVTQKKSVDRDGYSAVQLGFEQCDASRATRANIGHCKTAGKGILTFFKELRTDDPDSFNVGDSLTVALFAEGEFVDVSGISIGKGYQGVIKRWGFQGGRASHGSRFHRAPGSIGCSATPSRVLKNKKMPGQLGNSRVTVQRLQVVRIQEADNLMLIKGAVPGAKNGLLFIRESNK